MHKASLVQASGACFVLLGPQQTQLTSARPVTAVTAVRVEESRSAVHGITLFQNRDCSGERVAILTTQGTVSASLAIALRGRSHRC